MRLSVRREPSSDTHPSAECSEPNPRVLKGRKILAQIQARLAIAQSDGGRSERHPGLKRIKIKISLSSFAGEEGRGEEAFNRQQPWSATYWS